MAFSISKKRILDNEPLTKDSQKSKKHKKLSNYQAIKNQNAEKGSKELQAAHQRPSAKFDSSQTPTTKYDHHDETELIESTQSFSDSCSYSDSSKSNKPSIYTNSLKVKSTQRRNDPNIFANSMSKILSSKLNSSKRSDPVLARSIVAQKASKEVTDASLEVKARQKIRIDKKEILEKGRVRDVLGSGIALDFTQNTDSYSWKESFQKTTEDERRLRKTAQRGVVKLFNAVRAAQIKGEEASREARVKGVVGQRSKEDKINDMSKKGFLDLIAKGGRELIVESNKSS